MPKKPLPFSDQIRRAVRGCGLTHYRIAKEIGISHSLMSRFMSGQSGLSFDVLDRMAALIGLGVVVMKGTAKGQAKGKDTEVGARS